jgi:hypothetical protein
VLRRAFAVIVGSLFAGSLYLLLIDTTSLPELIVAAGAVLLAVTGLELAREEAIFEARARTRWVGRLHRPLLNAPRDIITVSVVALRQLVRPQPVTGQFRAVPFNCGDDERLENAKRALAESLGSFAPNTIIVGVDPERQLLLGHQLHVTGGEEALDMLELG